MAGKAPAFLCKFHLAITAVIGSNVHSVTMANSQDHEPVALVHRKVISKLLIFKGAQI